MKSSSSPALLILAASLLLAACSTPAQSPVTLAAPATRTATLPTSTRSRTPSPTPSPSPTHPACDPARADFCILEGSLLLLRPIVPPGMDSVDRSYAYGSTKAGSRDPHHGVEFYTGSGTPVRAAAAGTVFFAGNDEAGQFCPWSNFYGNLVVLKHELDHRSLYSLYAHLSRIDVSRGEAVLAGEKIAEVGATGSAIGSHLHFELRSEPYQYSSTLNPELWLDPLPGTGVLAMRFVDGNSQLLQARPNVQYYGNGDTVAQAWQPEPYDPELLTGQWENVVLGNLLAGRYRITFWWNGHLSERWVELQPGRLTQVQFLIP